MPPLTPGEVAYALKITGMKAGVKAQDSIANFPTGRTKPRRTPADCQSATQPTVGRRHNRIPETKKPADATAGGFTLWFLHHHQRS